MMETHPALVPHMGPPDVYDFHNNVEALGTMKPVQLPVDKVVGGMVDGITGSSSTDEKPEQPNKKRKRCGVCEPCLRKDPCGACFHCVHRSTSHQICKMRKCVHLMKKRVVPLKALESSLESITVDGPKTKQMETGPVNHAEAGRLKLESDTGLLNKECKELGNRLLMEANSWLSNTPIPQSSGDRDNWENPSVPNHAAINNNSNIEDAKNLVAFSAVAEAMSYGAPTSGTSPAVSMHLYEKFNYEMNRESSSLPAIKPPDHPEDVSTLKAALDLAKHGMKPPNCNCDGPECPDYLEWLENKLHSAVKDHPGSTHPPLTQVGRELVDNYPKDQVLALENKIAKCTSGTLPFSQNALSIAKEKNISLQTAIAIEALTQLSSALPQSDIDCPSSSSQSAFAPHGHLTHFTPAKNDQGHDLPLSCNELFQNSQYTGKNALPVSQPLRQTSWEQSKKASFQEEQYIPENHLLHAPPVFQNHTSTPQKSEFMQQWVQTPEQLKSPSDPMTGLKQLLGSADDYVKPVFKGPESLPTKVKKSRQNSVKKEAPAGKMYKMSPDQQQLSQMFQEPDFHRSAQMALQQHLHHKRNLFLDSNNGQGGLQDQPQWWVPNSQKVPKTMEKTIKEKKKRGQSPSQKKVEPKVKPVRKQIQIKKPRQKEGQPVFMPKTQISIDEFRRAPSVESHMKENDDPLPLQSFNPQEMCTESQGGGQSNSLSHAGSEASMCFEKGSAPTSSLDETSSSSVQAVNRQAKGGPASTQSDLIDDKFEDLIRQFEAEFGDSFPLPNTEHSSQNGASPSKFATELHSRLLPFSSQMLPPENTTHKINHSDPARSKLSLSQEMATNFESLFSPKSSKKIKIESSGALTVVSTTGFFSEENQQLDATPTKSDLPLNPSLSGFLESPLDYLTSPTKSLLDTPAKSAQSEFPTCTCVDQINEKDEGPYYTHLGSGPTVASIRELMESRFGEKGSAIRIEKVIYTGKEGKSSRGCPIAKWVIRRQSEEEKLLVLVRHRAGHHCENAYIIILIMAWEGIPRVLGDSLYSTITETITKYGNPTSRRCGLNDDRTCACQGKDPNTCGASFSFGCSWSMYFNGCKYARSKTPRKFRLIGDNPKEEGLLNDNFQNLATKVAPVYKMLAPQAYQNQVNNEDVAIDCRLGLEEGRPFSGVTACMDFCAHAHKDQHNLYNGCTVVCTLTKEDNRMVGKIAEDEQLHVLPLYKVSETDEFGNEEGQAEKIRKGGIQVLTAFPREVRKLPEPAKSCRQRQLEAKKAAAEKKKLQKEKLTTPDKIKQEAENNHNKQQNPGVPQQPAKPCIKMEPSNPYNNFKYNSNGVVESYSVLGSCRPSDPYSMNSVYSYHSFYAQPPNLPSMNGYHSKFALPSFGYYGYSGNPMVPSQYPNYGDVKTGGWMNNKKPEMQPGAENGSQGYGNESLEQNYGKFGDGRSTSTPHRTTPAPVDTNSYINKVIKKEPMNDYSYDPFHRAPSVPPQSPALNLSVQKNDQSSPFKANGALPSSERLNSDGSQSSYICKEKANLKNGLDKNNYFGAQANRMGLKSYHGQNKQWGAYEADAQADHHNSNTPRKVWSSCKLSGSSNNLTSTENAQDKNWIGGQAMKEAAVFQDKLWNSVAGNDRCSVTPSGIQEKSWNMFAAPSTPSTPFKSESWDPYSLDDPMEETPVKKEENEEEEWSDSEHNFLDDNIGGVAVAPGHGSILIECARRELHATTPLKKPNRGHPTRISLVFYQHKNLHQPNHGLALWEAKVKQLAERARIKQEEADRLGIKQEVKGSAKKRKWGGATTTPTPETPPVDREDTIPTRQTSTLLRNSFTTSSSYAYTKVTGPYNRWI
ncbi:methylcytosine dioxygenase TET3 [Gastrophryne carolinensis]